MNDQYIEALVMPNGTIVIEAHGYGPDCYEATRELERRLGQLKSDKPTSELYDEPVEREVKAVQGA